MRWHISDTHFFHKNIIKYCDRPFSSVNNMNKAMIDNWNTFIKKEDTVYFYGDFSLQKDKIKNLLNELNGYKILIKGNHDRGLKTMVELGFDEAYEYSQIKIGKYLVNQSHYPYIESDMTIIANLFNNRKDKTAVKIKTKSNSNCSYHVKDNNEFKSFEQSRKAFIKYAGKTVFIDNPKVVRRFFMKMKQLKIMFIGTRLINDNNVLIHGHTHSKDKVKNNMINMSVDAWVFKPASDSDILALIEKMSI